MYIKIKNNKINWICLADKCPSCCEYYEEDKNKKSFFDVRGTLIPLTPNDYKVFIKNGFKKFLIKEKDGGWYLNTAKNGTCSLFKKNKCSIYQICTASSCKSYPFFFDKYNGLVADMNCPGWGRGWTDMKKVKNMVKELIKVYECQIKKSKKQLGIK